MSQHSMHSVLIIHLTSIGATRQACGTCWCLRPRIREHSIQYQSTACIYNAKAPHAQHTLANAYPCYAQGLLDVLVFASQSRGDSDEQLAKILVSIVITSTEAEFDRRVQRLQGGQSGKHGELSHDWPCLWMGTCRNVFDRLYDMQPNVRAGKSGERWGRSHARQHLDMYHVHLCASYVIQVCRQTRLVVCCGVAKAVMGC